MICRITFRPDSVMQSLLRNLQSTRELRAEMLSLAARLSDSADQATLHLVTPRILDVTLREEWDRHLQVLKPELAGRMQLVIDSVRSEASGRSQHLVGYRSNDRHETLRLLLANAIDTRFTARSRSTTQSAIAKALGVSLTPVRTALRILTEVGLITSMRRPFLRPEWLSMELLGRINALPVTLRFRFTRGAQIRSPATLLERAIALLQDDPSWQPLALSGTTVAQAQVPALDLLGVPRLDLMLQGQPDPPIPVERLIRSIDEGLELEPNVVAPTPVSLTLSRCELPQTLLQIMDAGPVRCAHPADVCLALLDLDRRDLVLDYIAGLQA